ncbi:MAG: hypothetical protein HQ515_17915 [Phycisphaeraceae bacterium]|nr:hypothetical protein [Phycisphaeraceae bacterium]
MAIYGSEDFDVTSIDDPGSIILADSASDELTGASPVRWALGDINGDGIDDMGLLFKTQELRDYLGESSVAACLMGSIGEGLFMGIDTVDAFIKGKDKVDAGPKGKKK